MFITLLLLGGLFVVCVLFWWGLHKETIELYKKQRSNSINIMHMEANIEKMQEQFRELKNLEARVVEEVGNRLIDGIIEVSDDELEFLDE